MQKEYYDLLCQPPEKVVAERQRLSERALAIASDLCSVPNALESLPEDLDVGVAGSAFKVLYFLGVHMVLARLESGGHIRLHRYSGASSGAKAPFQLLLTGESSTVDSYLGYGVLWESCCRTGPCLLPALLKSDRLARTLIDWMLARHGDKLSTLDGRLFVLVGQWRRLRCHGRWLSSFSTENNCQQFVREAFYASGTLMTRCNGHWSCDGGLVPGRNRPQPFNGDLRQDILRIDPKRSAVPFTFCYSVDQAVEAIQMGQDDIMSFIRRLPVNRAAAYEDPEVPAIKLQRVVQHVRARTIQARPKADWDTEETLTFASHGSGGQAMRWQKQQS